MFSTVTLCYPSFIDHQYELVYKYMYMYLIPFSFFYQNNHLMDITLGIGLTNFLFYVVPCSCLLTLSKVKILNCNIETKILHFCSQKEFLSIFHAPPKKVDFMFCYSIKWFALKAVQVGDVNGKICKMMMFSM